MSNDRKPIARITFRKDRQTYSLISIWPGKFPGTYSISRDKGTDKKPPIALFDALKAWGAGEGYLDVSIESERDYSGQGGGYDRASPNGSRSNDAFNDDDQMPF